MVQQDNGSKSRKSGRSPSYPDIDLAQALDKANALWEREKQNMAPISAIGSHWGFKPNTGPATRAVAALKSFGLLDYTGRGKQRKAALTEFAVRIILDKREDSLERDLLVQQAALLPPIHSELWEDYKGSLPSDQTLQFELITERGFSEVGASSLVSEFRRTIEYAKLDLSSNMFANSGEESDMDPEPYPATTPIHQQATLLRSPNPAEQRILSLNTPAETVGPLETRTINLPLLNDGWAVLQYRYPLTEGDWSSMMAILDAMKPSLISVEDGTTTLSAESGQIDLAI